MYPNPPQFHSTLKNIGLAAVLYSMYRIFDHVTFFSLPPGSLSKYQRYGKAWALITGASAGIGFATAQELAIRGFNVILVGHLPEGLENAGKRIKESAPDTEVRIIVMNAEAVTREEIQTKLTTISSLPITILINNVGGFPVPQPIVRPFHGFSNKDIDLFINLNSRFMAHISRALLPRLDKNGPSMILNISSMCQMGMGGMALYSACKGFVTCLTTSLSREARIYQWKVDILSVVPGDVRTQANYGGIPSGTPCANQFARAMLNRTPRAIWRGYHEFMPWWTHSASTGILKLLPPFVQEAVLAAFVDYKKRGFAKELKSARSCIGKLLEIPVSGNDHAEVEENVFSVGGDDYGT